MDDDEREDGVLKYDFHRKLVPLLRNSEVYARMEVKVLSAFTSKYVHDIHPEKDVYWCTADVGWVTGHSYVVYGPLLNGATTVMFEGVPTYPSPARFWEVCEKLKVNQLYTAPTAIRALMACEPRFAQGHDLSSLKVIGSVGEPINEEAWQWYHDAIGGGKCSLVDT